MPGIGFEEAVKGSLQLQAVGISAKLAERALAGFANATARSGGGKVDFSEAMRQMTQIASVGKLTAEDLKTISARIPGFSRIINQAFGTTDNEKINAMGLSATQMVERITGALEKLPKATGGIRTAMDNMGDTLNMRLFIPLGRVAAAFAQAFGPALERLLNSAAPGFERLAVSMEKLSKTKLAGMFNATIGNMKALINTASVVAGVLVAMSGPRVVGAVVTGVTAMIRAVQALRTAIQSTGMVTIVMQAIATQGKSLAVLGASLAAGLAAAGGVNYALNNLFSGAGGAGGPSIPSDVVANGSPTSLMGSVVQTAIDAMSKQQIEKLNAQERLMMAIERNTAKTVSALDMRKQTLGGSELGKIGVTAAEIGTSNRQYAPPDTFQRPVASEYEKVQSKQIQRELGRMGHVGRLRNA
jgi:tape measure domain-containing protein